MPNATVEPSTELAPGVRVLRSLRESIDNGTFTPDEPLPSERVLAQQFGVARTTVRDALAKIAADGLVRSNGGRLRIVARPEERANGSGARASEMGPLSDTFLLVGNNPQGVVGHSRKLGSAAWIDQGVFSAVRESGLHYLAFNPATSLLGEEWERLVAGRPMAILTTEIMRGGYEAYAALRRTQKQGIPVIAYGNGPQCAGFDRVSSDHEAGAYGITKWLIGRGARRILQMAPDPADSYWFVARRAGYERAMGEAGLPSLPVFEVPTLPLPSTGEREERIENFHRLRRYYAGYLIDILGPGPGASELDAIVAPSDCSTMPLAAACRMLGRIANHDLLLTGYDNRFDDEDLVDELEPEGRPAISADKLNFAMGEALVRLAVERCTGQLPDQPQLRLVEPRLMPAELQTWTAAKP